MENNNNETINLTQGHSLELVHRCIDQKMSMSVASLAARYPNNAVPDEHYTCFAKGYYLALTDLMEVLEEAGIVKVSRPDDGLRF